MTRYPFKFLDAYTREDRTFFFGRDEEIARLYEIVFQADLILLHGASGTGRDYLRSKSISMIKVFGCLKSIRGCYSTGIIRPFLSLFGMCLRRGAGRKGSCCKICNN